MAHTITAARRAKRVDRVVVSTDDERIGAVSEWYGAEVIWRPAAISGDAASSESALLHALAHLEREKGYRPLLLTFLQCTSPLTAPEDIDGTIEALLRENANCALAVTPFHHFLWTADSEGNMCGVNHDRRFRRRRQDSPPQYLETGAVYVMDANAFRQEKHRFFGRVVSYVMPRDRVLEIDEPDDLRLAEAVAQAREI